MRSSTCFTIAIAALAFAALCHFIVLLIGLVTIQGIAP